MKKITQCSSRAVAMLLMTLAMCLPQKMFAYNQPTLGSDGYYQIATASNLAWFRDYVNASTAHAGVNARLTADINLSSVCSSSLGSWTPIAASSASYSSTTPYTGTFDGNSKTISGLYISAAANNNALFCYNGGTIKNLTVNGTVTGAYMYCAILASYNYGTISYCHSQGSLTEITGHSGGIVGLNVKTIDHCTNTATISGSTKYMDNNTYKFIGGIAGDNAANSQTDFATISYCSNKGEINMILSSVGGIAGYNSGKITDCFNQASITGKGHVGGIASYSYASNGYGKIINCFNTGDIASTTAQYLGALARPLTNTNINGLVINSYYLNSSKITLNANVYNATYFKFSAAIYGDSATVADFASGKITRLLNGGDRTTESATGVWGQVLGTDAYPVFMTSSSTQTVYNVTINDDANYGNNGKVVTIPSAVNHYVNKKIYTGDYTSNGTVYSGTYKIASSDVTLSQTLCDMSTLTETGTDSKTYYKISTPAQMKWFEYYVNDSTAHAATCAKLMNDINLSSICSATAGNWTPIASTDGYECTTTDTVLYKGIFDGNGKTISGLYINATNKNNQALFSQNGGTIKDLTVDAAMVHGSRICAAITSWNYGTISGCTSKGAISGDGNFVGGVTGHNNRNIDHCSNEATITGTSDIGGIAGSNFDGSITYCFNKGEISGSKNEIGGIAGINYTTTSTSQISNSVNQASVTGYGRVGGIVGYHNQGSVKDCYNIANVTSLGDYSSSVVSSPGAIAGYNAQGTITNCHYLSTITLLKSNAATSLVGVGNATGEANTYSWTADEFKSGQIARLLNGGDGTTESATSAWGQTLGTDTYPVLMTANKANAVYSLIINKKNNYGNTGKKFTLPAQLTYADLFIIADTCRDANKTIYKDSCKISNADLALTETIDTTFMTKLTETATDGKTYYQISTPLQMKWFEYYVNKSTANAATCAKLMNDINLSSICSATAGNWTPIANSNAGYSDASNGSHYSGIFDGNGKTISGLYIKATNSDNQALFFSNSGTIKNLTVDANINGSSNCAAISLGNDGMISGCTAKGTITGVASYIAGIAVLNRSDIEHCANEATVKSGNLFVGGIAADNKGNLNYCTNLGAVSSTAGDGVGGIVGINNTWAQMTNCYNQASISGYGEVGGIAGYAYGSVKVCYNTANVTSLGNYDCVVSSPGAIVGYSSSTITNCYYLSTITLKRNNKDTTLVGVGNGTNEAYTYSKTADEFKSGQIARLLNGGDGTTESPVSVWGQTLGTDTYPVFLAADSANAVCSVTINSEKSYHNANTTISLPDNGFGINGTKYGTLTGFSDGTKAYTGSYAIAAADVTLTSVFENGGDMADHLSNGYYQISTPEQLKWLAYFVNDANRSAAANAMLMNDIDLSTVCSATAGNWTPIGTTNRVFSYKFNGNGKTVSNLYIDKAATDHQGLFGRTSISATVMDLNVSGTVSSSAGYAAILVGENRGTITGCTSSGTVSGSMNVGGIAGANNGNGSITQCVNYATVNINSNSDNCIGGITGYNSAILTDCANFGVIKSLGGTENRVGGIVGDNDKTIKNCENLGKVYVADVLTEAYPIVGVNDGTTTNCYYLSASTTAATYGTPKTAAEFKSGIVARLLNGGDGTTESASTTNSDVSGWGQTIGTDTVPVFLASDNKNAVYRVFVNSTKNYGNTGSTLSLPALPTSAFYDDTKIEEAIGYVSKTSTYTDTYTFTAADDSLSYNMNVTYDMSTLTEKGTDGKTYYQISTPQQMKWFEYYVNKSTDNLATCAKLMNDIDLSSICSATAGNWKPIANHNNYSGVFDGNGKTISGLYIMNCTTSSYSALFNQNSGTIKNLTVDANVSEETDVAGAIAGYNDGTISYCTAKGKLTSAKNFSGGIVGHRNDGTIEYCTNEAIINGDGETGGIVAENHQKVSHCINKGKVTNSSDNSGANTGGIVGYSGGYSGGTGVFDCVNLATVTGGSFIGGIVGNVSDSIKNCYNLADVSTSSTASNIYIGAIVGDGGSQIANCYYSGAITLTKNGTATTLVGVGNGKNEAYTYSKTAAEFKSGIIARLLNGGDGTTESASSSWGQTIGTDAVPVFLASDKKNAVYRLVVNKTIKDYGNTNGTVDLASLSAGVATFDDTKISIPGSYTNGTTTYTDTYTFAAADDSIKSTSTTVTVTDMATLTETGTDGKTYYKISTPAQMKWFAYYVNKSSDNLATCAKLMKDIDLTSVCSTTVGNWTTIANYPNMYNGVFDGNGKTISNLYIANATTDYPGLFGVTNADAIIKDLNISGNVSSTTTRVALLINTNNGKIIRCTSSGTVSGPTYTSGIASTNSGSITQCMNYASIINTDRGVAGGIAANCNNGTVTDCANFGTIKATTNGYTSTGGVVGICRNTCTVKNCENLGQVYSDGALTEAYPILGTDVGTSTITNNYYLSASNDTAKYGTPKGDYAFKNGNIARLLNGGDGTKEVIMGTWGQTMDTDNHPVFMTADKKNAVYYCIIYWGNYYGYCYRNAGDNFAGNNQMCVLDSIADVSMLGTNVISSDKKANSIVLTDKKNFALPTDITAQSVTYTRNAYCDGYHETICLPFVPTTVPDGYDFSEYKSTSESEKTIYFTDATSWTAGKPYLMKYTGTPSSTQQTVTFSATNATVLAAPLTEDVFVGDFTIGSQNSSEYILGVYNDGKEIFRKTTDSYKTSPFRAHLNITTTTGAKENYSIDFGDDTTGISAAAALRNDGCIYDLQGRRIQIPVKGNVYIQDGKKFIYQK